MHFKTAEMYEGPPCDMCRRTNFIGTCTHRPMKMPKLELPPGTCPECVTPIDHPNHAKWHEQELKNNPLTQQDDLSLPEMLARLRSAGYMVAVHNDYKLHGALKTFWLFAHPATGTFLKGEGLTDEQAVKLVLDQVPEGLRPASAARDLILNAYTEKRNHEPECDCFIPTLEGAGQHSPACAIFKKREDAHE